MVWQQQKILILEIHCSQLMSTVFFLFFFVWLAVSSDNKCSASFRFLVCSLNHIVLTSIDFYWILFYWILFTQARASGTIMVPRTWTNICHEIKESCVCLFKVVTRKNMLILQAAISIWLHKYRQKKGLYAEDEELHTMEIEPKARLHRMLNYKDVTPTDIYKHW